MKCTKIISIIIILLCFQISSAAPKILLIVESDCLQSISQWIYSYKNAIVNIDHKHVEVISWTNPDAEKAQALRSRLQQEYFEAKSAGDDLEGAVLIGDICIPISAQFDFQTFMFTSAFFPMDHFFMDIVDQRVTPAVAYTSNDIPFPSYSISPGVSFFTGYYSGGDNIYDIWVSRINAAYLPTLREGNDLKDEYLIYSDYLGRVINRMNNPANVPSRGFIMGTPENITSSTPLDCMKNLNLQWFAKFDGVEQNTPYNWMSQLLAGPRGTITYGAFNGTLFPTAISSRNRRYCRYTQLDAFLWGASTSNMITIGAGDSLGWEWAGLFNHSCPVHSNFWACQFEQDKDYVYNGSFHHGTLGPFAGLNKEYSSNAQNGEYFRYYDGPEISNPYNFNVGTKGKYAYWRWPVNTNGAASKTFNVYASYVKLSDNDPAIGVTLKEASVNGNGVPEHDAGFPPSTKNGTIYGGAMDQTADRYDLPNTTIRWQRVLTDIPLHTGMMALVTLDFNHNMSNQVSRIADAVRFISTDGTVDEIVDDADPYTYSDQYNASYLVLSLKGFAFSDYIDRSYEDMGNEPGGNGLAKPQFYMMCACEINQFNYTKNIGTMYALGHNGLTCLGAAGPDRSHDYFRSPYINALKEGMDFGQALMAGFNNFSTTPYEPYYCLLGAGTLRAQPYIQYGSQIVQSRNITGTETPLNSSQPVLLRNVSVNGSGSWSVTSTVTSYNSFGYSEIVIRPECVFTPTGTNEIRFLAN